MHDGRRLVQTRNTSTNAISTVASIKDLDSALGRQAKQHRHRNNRVKSLMA
jgi:hypothetical protein